MARLSAWNKKNIISVTKPFPPFYWMQAYFFLPKKGPNGETYMRQNLYEILSREYFFGLLGEIKGRRMLDIGCGACDYMALMAELGGEISGIDLNEKQVEKGRELFAKTRLKGDFHVASAEILPFADETFDIIYSADVFEHISLDIKRASAKEIYRVLKPGGIVVIKTPNLDYLRVSINFRRLKRLLTLRSPFIHIAHTRNNPDNEHHGLTTYRELDRVFAEQLFLESQVVDLPLRKGPLFLSTKWWFPLRRVFNEHIVVSYRKAVFLPISERLSARLSESEFNPISQRAAGT